jgi:hypothetical protein
VQTSGSFLVSGTAATPHWRRAGTITSSAEGELAKQVDVGRTAAHGLAAARSVWFELLERGSELFDYMF